MKKNFALAGLAALTLALPAKALAFRTGAYVQMSDGSTCSTCQYIVAQGNGTPWVVATGSGRYWDTWYYDAVRNMDILPTGLGVLYNAWTDHFTTRGATYHMWARRPCPGGGYSFSQTLNYTFPANDTTGFVYGEASHNRRVDLPALAAGTDSTEPVDA